MCAARLLQDSADACHQLLAEPFIDVLQHCADEGTNEIERFLNAEPYVAAEVELAEGCDFG